MERKKELETLAAEFEHKWQATRLPDMDAYDLLDLMDYYSRSGMDFEAELCRRAAEQHDADNPEVILTRAHWAADDGDWVTARKERARAMPSRYDGLLFDVEYYVRAAELSRADQLIRQSLPSVLDLPEYDFLFDSAALLRDFGYIFYALKWLARISRDYTDYAQVQTLRSECYNLACQYAESKKLLNEELDANPFDQELWKQLAVTCLRAGDRPAAIDACEYALAIGPCEDAKQMRNFIYCAAKDELESVLSLAAAIQDYLTCEDCGDWLFMEGQYERAIPCYSYAGAFCPRGHRDRERIVVRLALCQVAAGQFADAYTQMMSLPALGGDHSGDFLEAAQSFFEAGQEDYAVSLLQFVTDSHEMCGPRVAQAAALLAHYACYEPARTVWTYVVAHSGNVPLSYKPLVDGAKARLNLP